MPKKVNRNLRILREYAEGGASHALKRRRIEAVAPRVTDGATEPTPAATWSATDTTLRRLRQLKKATLPKATFRAVSAVAAAASAAFTGDCSAATAVVRVVAPAAEHAFAAALGTLDAVARAGHSAPTADRRLVLAATTVAECRALRDRFDSAELRLEASLWAHWPQSSPLPAAGIVVTTTDVAAGLTDEQLQTVGAAVLFGVTEETPTAQLDLTARLRTAGRPVVVAGATLAAATQSTKAAREEGAPAPAAAELSFFAVEGDAKFRLLHALCCNGGAQKKVVVHCPTKQVAAFFSDALLALNAPVRILCDADVLPALDDEEATAPAADVSMNVARPGLPAPHVTQRVLHSFDTCKGGCVLFTAFGLAPRADAVLFYDPPRNPAELPALVHEAKAAGCGHVLLFVAPQHRTQAAPWLIQTAAAAGRPLVVKRLPTPAAAQNLIVSEDLAAVAKRLFLVNNQAYGAYRSLMLYYSLLRPKAIFGVDALDLTAQAAQFGLEEAPLLDLRTKHTAFRPREDVVKAANQRREADRRKFRDYAAAHLEAEQPSDDDE